MPHAVATDCEPAVLGLTAQWNQCVADHSRRVAVMSFRLARMLGMPDSERSELLRAALLLDVANAGLPEELLAETERPSPEEQPVLVQAPSFAHEWLRSVPLVGGAAAIIESIGEWFDGSGVPEGRLASDIPIGSRVLVVADAFDRLRHPRHEAQTARHSHSVRDALVELDQDRGRRFDPNVLDALIKLQTVN